MGISLNSQTSHDSDYVSNVNEYVTHQASSFKLIIKPIHAGSLT